MTTQQNKIANGKDFKKFLEHHDIQYDINAFHASIHDCFEANLKKTVFVMGRTPFNHKQFAQMWFMDAVSSFYDVEGVTLFSEMESLKDEFGEFIEYKAKDELEVNEVWLASKKRKVYETKEMMRHLADVFDSVTNCPDDLCKLNGEWGHENVLYEFVPDVEEPEHFSPRSPRFNREESERNRMEVIAERVRTRFDGSMG